MKNLFYILFGFLLFVGCNNEKDPEAKIEITTETNCVEINGRRFYKIELEGHQYYYRTYSTYGGRGTDLVHNPNCQCNQH
jgi:hypothetical protein